MKPPETVARGVRTASQELPELDPTLLLSPAGRQEMQAAQSMPAHRPLRGQTAVAAHFDDAGLFESPPEFGNRMASAAPVDLESMWMANTGIPYEPGATSGIAPEPATSRLEGFEFTTYDPQDFDLDAELGRGGGVRPSTRLRDQPRQVAPRPIASERGMREVTRVRDGRFSVLREDPEPPARTPRSPSAAELNAKQSAIQQARTLQENAKRPTAYQHLLANSLGDDD